MAKHSRKFGARCLSDLIEYCARMFKREGYDAEAYVSLHHIVHWRCQGARSTVAFMRYSRCMLHRRRAAFPQRSVV